MWELSEIQKALCKELSAKRYQHTLSVAYLSASLAMCYEENVEAAFLAGIIHDCAKCMTNNELLEMGSEYNIAYSDFEISNPFLLHAKAGAYIAEHVYEITDKDILNAVLYHTTGRPGMSFIEKAVYIADYLEFWRSHLSEDEFKILRSLGFHDINRTVYSIADITVKYLKGAGKKIDELSIDTRDYYKKFTDA